METTILGLHSMTAQKTRKVSQSLQNSEDPKVKLGSIGILCVFQIT